LAAVVLWLGLYPRPLLTIMDRSVSHLLEQVETGTVVLEASVATFDEKIQTLNPGH
jgi:NADH:ubiquinone oxidoreductase subunit 4 (subunit M)